MRLLLAVIVAVAHAGAIGFGTQPHLGATEVGAMAVDAFFVLSGFLVTRSLMRLSMGRYAWHRFLRIMPGFWVCLLVTALAVGPGLARLEGRDPLAALTGSPSTLSYVPANALLFVTDWSVGGLPSGTYTPGVVNGALWTLFYEATCYVGIAVLGVLGVLRRRRWVPVLGVALIGLVVAVGEVAGLDLPGDLFLRFFLAFGLGALGHVFADRIPMRRSLLLLAAAALAVSLATTTQYLAFGALPFAYLCLYAVVRTPWLRHEPPADLSYGLYVYHWPVLALLATAGATALGRPLFTVLGLALALLAAAASWYAVEKPALSLKNLGR
ncbi:acyltransferase family protein [Agilicoccus flavus]|uniref:acyltransferase family protein n=1 Tax=Agilicoccus flavus TaxID=2775968 RepID=UPI001CF69A24|nr:acyltransferase [Agilicoccus flavus]